MDPWWPVLSLSLFLIWLFIAASFLRLVPQKELKSKHLKDPVQSFAAGTWIAGTSVCGTVMIKHFPTWEWLVQGMAWFALFLWGYYIVLSLRNFHKIIRYGLSHKVHGVVLLSTVSTQSLVILFKTLYGESIPLWIQSGMIMMGTGFYFLGFYLIMKRFIRIGSWNIVDDWPNTNCILHGAMSITGLASTVTGAVPPDLTLVIWFWVLLWFVIVEGVECWRVAARIRRYGLIRGIGVHHISQWSRNFTFGMLYTFTMFFDLTRTSLAEIQLLRTIQNAILDYGAWVVLALLVYELLLFMKEKWVVIRPVDHRSLG